MPEIVAHYLAQAILHRQDLKRHAGIATDHPTMTILLWLLANDSLMASLATETNPLQAHTWGYSNVTFEQQYEYYDKQDYRLQQLLEDHITSTLQEFADCFEKSMWLPYHFVNAHGLRKLEEDHPRVWESVRSMKVKT